ncbi:hypothetical protein AZF37_09765 (plasmid) [endosymbiont 'TC1' of Trimyema compressum]|uniref:hypothetical protein n=1 Tax=endosymbiont 'TC1' of Trimyema compressum TaxID=243899 RepID=UPI0007F0D66C|nr:hypothetical protein [endosymbiont 'TC1' of Trimyema compressum]AMP21460.1 hypothetical protein AZF37_09765 [endosymbiont 'TC1' of Trimyema compressum]
MINELRDGILEVCEMQKAKNNMGQLEDTNLVVLFSSFFQKRRISNNDKELARQESYSIDLSVRIPLIFKTLKATDLVRINNTLYEIKNIYEDYKERRIDIVLGRIK